MTEIRIRGIACELPHTRVDNAELVRQFGTWTEDKIYQKTGIRERRVATTELVSDLATGACERLFADMPAFDRNEVDMLLLCTETPDYYMPATACLVHRRLGLRQDAGALDFNLGCSGFIYGLALARSLVVSGVARNVLLVTADTLSKTVNPMDKSTRTIFGDAAAATLVGTGEDGGAIGGFVLGTDGSGAEKLLIPAGGFALPHSSETAVERTNMWGNVRSQDNLYMNGPEILDFTVRTVPGCVRDVLERHAMTMEDIDLFVFHQATRLILEHLRKEMEIPEDRFYVCMERTGNTVSSTIPIALAGAVREGRVRPGSRIMLVGFGVGFSWGATILTWN